MNAQRALDDARACADLVRIYLRRAAESGVEWLDEVGAVGAVPATRWAPSGGTPTMRR
ncbi:hypothetical protein [Herbidospora sp. RD11066]